MPSRDLVEKCKTAAKAARDAHIEQPLSRCYGVIVDAVLSVVADELKVPTIDMREAAKEAGRVLVPAHLGAMREAFGEVAEQGLCAALSVSPLMKDEAR